jgi:uncharacterized protein YbjQ (UPF0145 family)
VSTGDWIDVIFGIGIPLLLIVIGFTIGKVTERRHFASLARREAQIGPMLVSNVRPYAPGALASPPPQMVVVEVVISADYFKTFVAGLKKIIGGELRTYENIARRARAEALLRLKETAQRAGYNAMCNVRVDAADVAGKKQQGQAKAQAAMVGVIASATAYRIG